MSDNNEGMRSSSQSSRASRKRKHGDGDVLGDPEHTAGCASASATCSRARTSAAAIPSSSSVQDLLSVPLDVILRECAPPPASQVPQRRRALLSKSEASTLLRTSQLAMEFDVLLDLAAVALERMRECREFRTQIEDGTHHHGTHGLRSILPILHYHGSVGSGTIRHVRAESERVLLELVGCADTLRKCSDQNWEMAQGLREILGGAADGDAGGSGGLVQEKSAVSEIEEAVCERIDGLVRMASSNQLTAAAPAAATAAVDPLPTDEGGSKRQKQERTPDVFDASVDSTGKFEPMRDLCRKLLGIEKTSEDQTNQTDEHAEAIKSAEKEAAAIAASPAAASAADGAVVVEAAENNGIAEPSSVPEKPGETLNVQPSPANNDIRNENAGVANDGTVESSEAAVSTSQRTSGTDATDGSRIVETSEDEEEAGGGRSSSSSSPSSSPDGSMGRGVGTQNAAAALAVMASS